MRTKAERGRYEGSFEGSLVWLGIVAVWLVLFNRIGSHTWGYGRSTFFWIVLSIALLFGASTLGRLFGRIGSTRLVLYSALALSIALVATFVSSAWTETHGPEITAGANDIALNTYAAGTAFLEGKNPYEEPAQLWHRIEPSSHVVVRDGTVLMYGIRYSYGYPYFPMMFLSYLPFRPLVGGILSLPAANGLFTLAILIGSLWLMHRLVPGPASWTAALLTVIATVGVRVLPDELFHLGVTDIVIAVYLLYALIALSYGASTTAGVLVGLAQACKLLPAPMIVLPLLIWLWGRRGFWPFAIAYAVTTAAILLPFILWDWQLFLSSTIVFYATFHAAGDDTSLWFFLPSALKTPFNTLGIALSSSMIGWTVRKREGDLLWPVSLGYASYATLVAFAQMSHLNYLWSAYPLGCVALVAHITRGVASKKPEQPSHQIEGVVTRREGDYC